MSVAIYMGWQAFSAARQHTMLNRLLAEQEQVAKRAAEAETNMQSMMMDLLRLSSKDATAKAIVVQYNITYKPDSQIPALALRRPEPAGVSTGSQAAAASNAPPPAMPR
jgi:hypothetical protein